MAGPRIAKIVPDGPAEKAGLKVGDIVNQMDGKKYSEMELLFRAVREKKAGDKVTLTILRKNEVLTLSVKLEPKE